MFDVKFLALENLDFGRLHVGRTNKQLDLLLPAYAIEVDRLRKQLLERIKVERIHLIG